jgi:hypothetical protein
MRSHFYLLDMTAFRLSPRFFSVSLAPAAAINLERVADWFAGVDREKTKTSVFARVMTSLAAPL